ncbi:theronine dehydrogenase [Deinococcus sp. HMF7604]|uniref:theronine dehydrogenase n=1 Tax=Deinococcus betulae TaxID=2873312 RepID=UPI001CCFB7E3|nr:theronine dehydrogenase [Deinococcus betulae]MBZ9751628.1 theronine dehydrogenase [Deinococcus betulae]
MRLVAHAPNRLRWDAVPDRPPGPGEVSVRTHFSALSVASELTLLHAGPFPAALGYQTLGTVEAVGAGVTLTPGTRVVTTLGHASHGFHPAGRVVPVPPHVSDRAALCAILGEETHKGLRKVRPRPGEAVLVAGAGLLGLLSIFNLTRRGVHEVHVLEPRADRRALALTFGAAAVHAPGELPHDRFQVGVECNASPAGFTELVSHLAPRGRCVVLSWQNPAPLALGRAERVAVSRRRSKWNGWWRSPTIHATQYRRQMGMAAPSACRPPFTSGRCRWWAPMTAKITRPTRTGCGPTPTRCWTTSFR